MFFCRGEHKQQTHPRAACATRPNSVPISSMYRVWLRCSPLGCASGTPA